MYTSLYYKLVYNYYIPVFEIVKHWGKGNLPLASHHLTTWEGKLMSKSPSPLSIIPSVNDPISSSHQAVYRSSFASRSLVGAFLGLA
jgi:hypothetical protein